MIKKQRTVPKPPDDFTMKKKRAPRNRTLTLTEEDERRLESTVVSCVPKEPIASFPDGIVHGDCLKWAQQLPKSVDLLILDPPYNMNKSFNGRKFSRVDSKDYTEYLDEIITALKPTLKETASVYICGDWLSSHSIYEAAEKHFHVRNRITWEREKGRGAKTNWKNASEDVWFCTVSKEYCFNVEAVKLRRKVIAPYTDSNGDPKDWNKTTTGNFRDTHPSNLWTDISIPFWSMPENTDHPTQKSEKFIAKLILASTNANDLVFDPFVGSGTTCVTAKKLGRRYFGIDAELEYVLWGLRRLELASETPCIQGYTDGVFWERNTLAVQQEVSATAAINVNIQGMRNEGINTKDE